MFYTTCHDQREYSRVLKIKDEETAVFYIVA
jgi:hypothetical protein